MTLPLHWILRNSAIAVTYFLLGRVGLELALPPGYVSAIWPAAGLAFAVTMLWGPRQVWLGILLGSAVTNASIGGGFHMDTLAVVIALGSTLQATVGGLWLRRSLPTMELNGPESVIRFSIVGIVSSAIAASVGNAALLAHGFISWAQVPQSVATWWMGDAFGVQIFGPLTLLVLAPNATWRNRRISVGLPLVLSFVLCGLIYYFVLANQEQQLQNSFGETVAPFETEMRNLDRFHGQSLSQLAASYNVRQQAPGPEMQALATDMMKSLTAFSAVAWAPVLDAAAQRRYAGPIQRPPGGLPPSDGFAAPIQLIFPIAGNEAAIGSDLLSQPQGAQTVRKALSSGVLAATAPLQLLRDSRGPSTIMLVAPVINQATQGVMAGVIDLRQIGSTLKGIPGIEWEIRDLSDPQNTVVYKSSAHSFPSFTGTSHLDRKGVYRQLEIQLADRNWHVRLYVSHKQLIVQRSNAPLLVLLMAFLSCGIFSTFALIMSTHKERVDSTVREKTLALNAEIEGRSEIQKKLEEAKNIAEHANLAKSQFLTTMSHEIRTPMNGILGMAQLLLVDGTPDATRKKYVRVILGSGQTLLTLLNDILDLSKVESGKLELMDVRFDPVALLDEIATLFNEVGDEKGLTISAQWVGGERRYLGDAMRLRQMLSNLLSNAIKFSDSGAIVMQAKEISNTSPHGAASESLVEFSVQDDGIGLTPEQQAQLFQPFTQVDSSATRRFGGTGLGLSIVRRLAEKMGGTAGIDSEIGRGSRFWFRVRLANLPLGTEPREVSRTSFATPLPMPIPASVAAKTPFLVLVVEDNAINRMVAVGLLEQLGCKVTVAENGAIALALLKSWDGPRPGLVLMDCQMPVMDGFEATAAIRTWEVAQGLPHLRIVALTAGAFAEERDRCLAVGMDDFLAKPVAFDALAKLVDA